MIEVQTCGHEETIDSAQITIRLIRGIDAVQSRNKKKITVYIHGMSRLILTYRWGLISDFRTEFSVSKRLEVAERSRGIAIFNRYAISIKKFKLVLDDER